MNSKLEIVFNMKPTYERYAAMLMDEGKSAEFIARELTDLGVSCTRFPVGEWMRERKAKLAESD